MDASISHSSRLKLISVKRGPSSGNSAPVFCRGRRLNVLRRRWSRLVSAGGRVCGQDFAGREASGYAGRATHEIRAGHQPQNRQSARPRPPGRLRGCVSASSVCSLETPPHYANFPQADGRAFLPLPASVASAPQIICPMKMKTRPRKSTTMTINR